MDLTLNIDIWFERQLEAELREMFPRYAFDVSICEDPDNTSGFILAIDWSRPGVPDKGVEFPLIGTPISEIVTKVAEKIHESR